MQKNITNQLKQSFIPHKVYSNFTIENQFHAKTNQMEISPTKSRFTNSSQKGGLSEPKQPLKMVHVQKTGEDRQQLKKQHFGMTENIQNSIISSSTVTSIDVPENSHKGKLLYKNNLVIFALTGITEGKFKSCLSKLKEFSGLVEYRSTKNTITNKDLFLIKLSSHEKKRRNRFILSLLQIVKHSNKKNQLNYGVTKVIPVSQKIRFRYNHEFEVSECLLQKSLGHQVHLKQKEHNVMRFQNLFQAASCILLLDVIGYSIQLNTSLQEDKLPTEAEIQKMPKNIQCYSLKSIIFEEVKKFTSSGLKFEANHVQTTISLTLINQSECLIYSKHDLVDDQYLSTSH